MLKELLLLFQRVLNMPVNMNTILVILFYVELVKILY